MGIVERERMGDWGDFGWWGIGKKCKVRNVCIVNVVGLINKKRVDGTVMWSGAPL